MGINFRSSFFSGIDEKKIKLLAYTFCGFCAGIAGLVASSNIQTSDANNIGLNFELDAILAVVIGGTLMGLGGRFSLLASVIGALVIQATTTSMYAIGVPAIAVLAVKGVVVIFVILLYSEQVRGFVRRITGQKGGETMMQKISTFFSNNRRFFPFSATIVLFFVAYAVGAISIQVCGIRRCFSIYSATALFC